MRSAAPPAQSFSHSQQQTRTHSSRAVLTAAEQYSQEQSGSITKKKSSLQCSTSTHLMMGANWELPRLRSGARSKVFGAGCERAPGQRRWRRFRRHQLSKIGRSLHLHPGSGAWSGVWWWNWCDRCSGHQSGHPSHHSATRRQFGGICQVSVVKLRPKK